ncbi:M48 family metallopeptidase [Massilia endophytica]|uniref:M48 family metallopeptidase n=1 Tax=Massilia endophytica TaxID=2899220 RepID=UPI001E47C855|nr:M48 family metallopeptidase [Massilia endophytica]UGQ45272.1 M48 family metallopeptidase [Massilia endophytica]
MAGEKNNNRNAWAAIAAALLLSACATTAPPPAPPSEPVAPPPPSEPVVTARQAAARETLRTMVNLQDRLYRVAAPILINNAELCRTQARNLLGFTAKNRWSYPGEYNDASAAVLGYDDVLQVSGILPGSGAARAGLRKGDDLVAADGKNLPTGRDAESKAAAVFGPLVSSRASLSMTIARNGNRQTLNVPVTRACAIRVDLGNSDNINSYADGSRVLVTRGMINFAQSDENLAYVLAKDIAHNVLGHSVTMRNNAAIGSIIDNLASVNPDLNMLIGTAGMKAYPLDMEIAADNLALYMLARAGYSIDKYKSFWQRVFTQYPPTVLNGYSATHPNATGRMAPIDRSVAEIKSKQNAKRPLTP